MKKVDEGFGQINQKLIIITRRDLHPGYQAVQSTHAGIGFQHEYPEIAKQWYNQSNYLVQLSVENEERLFLCLEKFKYYGLKTYEFREPDIGNQLTAIAVEPSEKTRKLTSKLPLALKEVNQNQKHLKYYEKTCYIRTRRY